MFDATEYSDLLGRIYDASVDARLWSSVLGDTCRFIKAGGAALFIEDNQHRSTPLFYTHNIPTEGACDYLQHYVRRDPRVAHLVQNPHLEVCWDYQHITERQMDRDEYYDWVCKASGYRYYVGGKSVSVRGYNGWIAPQRTPRQGHFDKSEIDVFRDHCLSHKTLG